MKYAKAVHDTFVTNTLPAEDSTEETAEETTEETTEETEGE